MLSLLAFALGVTNLTGVFVSPAQDRKVVESREFVLRIQAGERPAHQALWVSRDGGQTWKPAREAGVTETWGEWAEGLIRCSVQVPEEGAYDFQAQLGDVLSNRSPEPAPGQLPDAKSGARIDVRARRTEGMLAWAAPKAGEELIGGNQVVFRWTGDAVALKPKSVQIYAQLPGQPWKAVASGLDASGSFHWLLPSVAAPSKIRFRLAGLGPADQEASAPEIEGTIIPGRTSAGLVWEEPRGGAPLRAGQTLTLRWNSSAAEFRERSAELQYAVDAEPWVTITRGFEASGQYTWVVPNRETSQLRLRVKAITRAGQEAAAETEPLSVRGTQRPNVAQARALYDRARVLHAQQRLTEAQIKYEEALAAWSDFGEVFNDLGKLHADLRDPAKALEYYLRARKACPSHPTPYVNAARVQVQMGLHEDAIADLRDAVDLGLEKDERASVLAGETLWSIAREASLANRVERATAACEMILKIRLASRPTRAKAEQQLEWLRK